MLNPNLSTPGERLRFARKRAGFETAKAAAESLGLKDVSYRAYENDQHGFARHALKISKAFRVQVDWLLEGTHSPILDQGATVSIATPADPHSKSPVELIDEVKALIHEAREAQLKAQLKLEKLELKIIGLDEARGIP